MEEPLLPAPPPAASSAAPSPTAQRVVAAIQSFRITKRQAPTENYVENRLWTHLLDSFDEVHRQYNIGGFFGLAVDLDIGPGIVGVEIKLARELTSAAVVMRLLGQVAYFNQRVYQGNLVVAIVGDPVLEHTPVLKELFGVLRGLSAHVVFVPIEP